LVPPDGAALLDEQATSADLFDLSGKVAFIAARFVTGQVVYVDRGITASQ
jgi:hypothetical protein